PLSPRICKGRNVEVDLSVSNIYNWSPSTGLSATNGAEILASPAVTTTYTITGTACAATGTVVVQVDTVPVIKLTPGSETICSGQVINVTASGAASYKWYPDKCLSQTSGASVMVNPGFDITYT